MLGGRYQGNGNGEGPPLNAALCAAGCVLVESGDGPHWKAQQGAREPTVMLDLAKEPGH